MAEISIYKANETDFITNGSSLRNSTLCIVEEELNGKYTLELEYPIFGNEKHLLLKEENIIKADGQLFRIHKSIGSLGYKQVFARHIFYDLLHNFLEDVRPTDMNGTNALNWILDNTQYPHNFRGVSDIGTIATQYYVRKNPVEAMLGSDSLSTRWGGEIERDNFIIRFLRRRGSNKGAKIAYGKNLLGLEVERDMDTVATRIMPVGNDGLMLPEKYIDSPLIDNYNRVYIKTVDINIGVVEGGEDTEAVTEEQAFTFMRDAVNNLYVLDKIDIPYININADLLLLENTEEYKHLKHLSKVKLGDTVSCTDNPLQVEFEARVIKVKKNILTGNNEEVELGQFKKGISDSIKDVIDKVRDEIEGEQSDLEAAIDRATDLITSALGGYVIKREGEILIMDTEDPNTATKVWRFNLNGLGYSGTGIDGPYRLAMTMDGEFVADFITTGILNASLLKSGMIKAQKGSDFWNIENGDLKIGGITQTGDHVEIVADRIVLRTGEKEESLKEVVDGAIDVVTDDIKDKQDKIEEDLREYISKDIGISKSQLARFNAFIRMMAKKHLERNLSSEELITLNEFGAWIVEDRDIQTNNFDIVYNDENLYGEEKTNLNTTYNQLLNGVYGRLETQITNIKSDNKVFPITKDIIQAIVVESMTFFNNFDTAMNIAKKFIQDEIAQDAEDSRINSEWAIEELEGLITSDIGSFETQFTNIQAFVGFLYRQGEITQLNKSKLYDFKIWLIDAIDVAQHNYRLIYNNQHLTGSNKTTLEAVYVDLFTNVYIAIQDLIDVLYTASVVTLANKELMDSIVDNSNSKFSAYFKAIEKAKDDIQKDIDYVTSGIGDKVNDISNDGKVTPKEKLKLKIEYDEVVAERDGLVSQAEWHFIYAEKTAYVSAYNNLIGFLDPLLTNMDITSNTNGATMRNRFMLYYDARGTLDKEIARKAKADVDGKMETHNLRTELELSLTTAKLQARFINLVGAVTVLSGIADNLGTINAGRMYGPGMDVNLNNGTLTMSGGMRIDNANGQTIIDGSSNMFKISAERTLPVTNAANRVNYTEVYPHYQGQTPAFMAFQVNAPTDSGLFGSIPLPAIGISGTAGGVTIGSILRVSVDNTNIYVNFARETASSFYPTIKVFLFKEALV